MPNHYRSNPSAKNPTWLAAATHTTTAITQSLSASIHTGIDAIGTIFGVRKTRLRTAPSAKHAAQVKPSTNRYQVWKNQIQKLLKQTFAYYIVFYQLVTTTKNWPLCIVATVCLVIQTTILPVIFYKQQGLWVVAVTGKSLSLLATGVNFVSVVTVISALNFIVQRVHSYFTAAVTSGMRNHTLAYIKEKNNLLHLQEEEGKLLKSQNQDLKGATIAKTLASDVDNFISLFINLHKYFGLVAYWVVRSLIGLYQIGLFQQGLWLLSCAVLGSFVIGRVLAMGDTSEKRGTSTNQFELFLQNLVSARRSHSYPNFTKFSIDMLNRFAENIKKYSLKEDWLEQMATVLSGMVYKIAEPVLVVSMFIVPYLETSMTYEVLQGNLSSLMNLFFAASSSILFTYELGLLETTYRHINRLYDQFFSQGSARTPTTFRGLSAVGQMETSEYRTSAEQETNVVHFLAELYLATSTHKGSQHPSLFKSYHAPYGSTNSESQSSEKQPIHLHPNEMVYVVGENGSGKSILFNTLSGCLPGMHLSPDIEHTKGVFSLYCEQKLIPLPQSNASRPLTPMQILFLMWPEQQATQITAVNDDTLLTYHTVEGEKKSVTVSTMKIAINGYLKALQYSLNCNFPSQNGLVAKCLTTIEELSDYQCDFNEMSGGQQTKLRLAMYFAMAQILKPRLFLVDEPYNHIDQKGKKAVRETIRYMKKIGVFKNSTVLVVTHDDNNDLDLPHYDKVMAILPNHDHTIGYYGKVATYIQWLTQRNQKLEESHDLQQTHISSQQESAQFFGFFHETFWQDIQQKKPFTEVDTHRTYTIAS